MKILVHVAKGHSASTKLTPHCQIVAILMSLKHGNSLLLNQEIKNGQTTAENQRARARGNPRWSLGFSWLPDRPFLFDGLKASLATVSMPSQ